jgi:hypothetical protein
MGIPQWKVSSARRLQNDLSCKFKNYIQQRDMSDKPEAVQAARERVARVLANSEVRLVGDLLYHADLETIARDYERLVADRLAHADAVAQSQLLIAELREKLASCAREIGKLCDECEHGEMSEHECLNRITNVLDGTRRFESDSV